MSIPNLYIMKKFTCKDMGISCDFEVRGQNFEEVLDSATRHAEEKHWEEIEQRIKK